MKAKHIKAIKLALEALEFIPQSGSMLGSQAETKRLQAIAALRQALEQPAQKCSYPYCGCNSKAWCKVERNEALDKKAENARELGLDYEPVQEPVAWKHDCAALLTNDVELWIDRCPHCGKPHTSPPAQRKPLTDEEARKLIKVGPVYAPDGVVTRSPIAYRKELEEAGLRGLRKGEAAHGIKENT